MFHFVSSYNIATVRFCFIALVLFFFSAVFFSPDVAKADVKISGFVDFNYGTWASGSVSRSTDMCVYNSDGVAYLITAEGGSGAFRISNGGHNLPYSVDFKTSSGSYVTLSQGASQSFSGANQASENCGGSTNASLRCTFSSTDLESAPPGSYSGTLSITLEPT